MLNYEQPARFVALVSRFIDQERCQGIVKMNGWILTRDYRQEYDFFPSNGIVNSLTFILTPLSLSNAHPHAS